MKIHHKYIHIYILFMHLTNIVHQSIHMQLAPKVVMNLDTFWRVLLHINGIRSWDKHFWIFACGGNENQWTNVCLCAELWGPAKVLMEQEETFHFDKIAGFVSDKAIWNEKQD
eukprot:376987_1